MKKFLGLVAVSLIAATGVFAQARQNPHGIASMARIGFSAPVPFSTLIAGKISTNPGSGLVRLDFTVVNTNSFGVTLYTLNSAGVTNPIAALGPSGLNATNNVASNVYQVTYPLVDSETVYYATTTASITNKIIVSELWGKIQP